MNCGPNSAVIADGRVNAVPLPAGVTRHARGCLGRSVRPLLMPATRPSMIEGCRRVHGPGQPAELGDPGGSRSRAMGVEVVEPLPMGDRQYPWGRTTGEPRIDPSISLVG